MKALYFNCKSGISGDMVVGSLLNFFSKESLISELNKLNLVNYKIKARRVNKKGKKAIKFDVITKKEIKHRNLKDIHKIINESRLSKDIKLLSKKIFLNLARSEAKAHKTTISKIHFHEVGAIDSIIDIISASVLICKLGIKNVYSSRIAVGRGKIKTMHGVMNLPAPAVRELLKDTPIKILNIGKELTTPTGAAIIKTLAKDFVDMSEIIPLVPETIGQSSLSTQESGMISEHVKNHPTKGGASKICHPPQKVVFNDINIRVHKKGYGAGKMNLKIPNVLEAIIGDVKMAKDKQIILETNIDDMNPQLYEYVIDKLVKGGANDAFIQPIIMKKNRIGTLLTAICDEALKDRMAEIIFDETTTFGIRINKISRIKLDREIKQVKTKYGVINIKIGKYKGKIRSVAPEYEDCKRIARNKKIPLKEVYDEAKRL